MKDLILDLRKKGKTVLMCSHRLDDVQDVCDRIAILYNGDLQTLGKVSTLVEDAVRLEVRASKVKESPELKAELEAVFKKHGGQLETVGHPTTHAGRAVPADRRGVEGPARPALPAAADGRTRPAAPQGQRRSVASEPAASGVGFESSYWWQATARQRFTPVMSSALFGILQLDRGEPLGYANVTGLVQAWLQDAGGFAMVGLVVYLLYALLTPTDKSQSEKIRVPVTQFMVAMAALGPDLLRRLLVLC